MLLAGSAIGPGGTIQDQPFHDKNRGIVVVLDGRIDNREDLRQGLDGYPFDTGSDAEILAAVFAHWGTTGLKRLRGAFAFAIVDTKSRRTYLARDPMGTRPLYVAQWADGMHFGSSVLGLVATADMEVSLEIESDVLTSWWKSDYVPPDRSLLADCKPVMPGQVLAFDWDGMPQGQDNCVPESRVEIPNTPEEAVERLNQILRQSIRRAFENSSCPVSFLSGGVDSTVLTEMMQSLGAARAVSMGGNRFICPDSRYARYAADRIGIPLEFEFAPARNCTEIIAWAMDLQDEPLCMTHFVMLALMCRRAQEHTKVVIIGEAADRMFCGGHEPAWFIAGDTPALNAEKGEAEEISMGPPGPHWMSCWARHWGNHTLLGHTIPMIERATSEQGMDLRTPFLEWDLVCFAKELPPEVMFFGGVDKALLKAQLKGWPSCFVERPKINSTYRYRWLWALRCYEGLRELVCPHAAEMFGDLVPPPLRRRPSRWRTLDFFRYFTAAWKLLAWSRFTRRFGEARSVALAKEPVWGR